MINSPFLIISLLLLLIQAIVLAWYGSIFMIKTGLIKTFFPFVLIGITRAYAAAFFFFGLSGNPIWIWATLETLNVFALFQLFFSLKNE